MTAENDQSSSKGNNQLRLLPGTVILQPGDPIEFWHAQGLVLGNYESPVPGRQSLVVRTEAGEPLTIDAGQIVGVWREDEMSGHLPLGSVTAGADGDDIGDGGSSAAVVAGWAEVREKTRALLQGTPARGLDLGAFWRAASSRGKGFVVTPAHAAEFLFGAESPAKLGLRKRPPFRFRSPGEAFRPSAVERAAAAHVIAGERSRFKRVVSKRLGPAGVGPDGGGGSGKKRARGGGKGGGAEGDVLVADVGDGAGGARGGGGRGGTVDAQGRDERKKEEEEELNQPVLISVGGFKAVDQSVAVTREVADFCRVVGEVKRAAAAAAAGVAAGYGDAAAAEEGGAGSALARAGLFEPAFLLILHSLEAFAIGGDEQSLIPEAKRVMVEITGKANPTAAKSILVDVGLWTSRRQPEEEGGKPGEEGGEVGRDEAGEEGGVIPWSAEALEAAAALGGERARRRANYGKRRALEEVGAPAPFGRHDFRGASFGVYCIDGAGTRFLDDAFSVDPETREVFIHITDVQGLVPTGSTLDDVARMRAASEYLPQGPLFMMPPTALKAMSFSDKGVNEAVTVGIRLDPKTGGVASSRVMLTTLPPAVPLTFEQTDRLLEAAEKGETGEGRLARVAKEIQALEYVGRRSAEASGRRERGREGVKFRKGPDGETQALEVAASRAQSLVDELLTVYTQEVYRLCKRAGVAMPSLVGQQDRVATGRSRYGTGPLRRYIDILAQRQIAAILRGSGYLNKKDLMETASYLTWRQNKTRASRDEEASRLSLEALAAHCLAQTRATGLEHAVVPARGTGRGREVRLEGLGGVGRGGGGGGGVCVHAKRAPGSGGRGVAIRKGQAVRVVIQKVEPQLKQVVATEFVDGMEGGAGRGGDRGADVVQAGDK
ncbi:weakly similar to cyanobacterial Exoribonuclease II [Ectocarpus siliculosus]|uniref:Weakly similar to cyanobacterial Exoribonuclease II n=1 Tax=Ectocarpus siliculosus TaxID=2880 RepID=D8LHL6_ECTSI|nr:weakly similar to cyanobacterial Exoribonuclease II [Ectocarpus siliculosus]|eukprot:CBN79298.1 weakly similar to cyanobacterial Exoribonuclease II [Ectocarpus siliculosus]